MKKKSVAFLVLFTFLLTSLVWSATYTGTTIVDIDVATPDGSTEPVSILDDAIKEIKTVLTGTKYNWTKLTNKTGAALAAGEVVAIDTSNNSAVALGDTSASILQYVIALQTIAINANGLFATHGVVANVKSTGVIARGQYVKKSVTTLVIDDAGTAVSTTNQPPVGSIGIALDATASNLVTVYFWGRPHTGITSTTCTNQFIRSQTTAGVGTCASVANADLAGSIAASKLIGTDITSLANLVTIGTITTGNWNGTAISTTYGGTGQNFSGTAQGNVLYFSGAGTLAALAPG